MGLFSICTSRADFFETLSEGMEQETLLAVLSFAACNAPGVHRCEFKITIGG
jgi:hypothetical protein